MVNIGSLFTGGRLSAVRPDLGRTVLTSPVSTEVEGKKMPYLKSWETLAFNWLGLKRKGVTIKPVVDDDWRIK